MRIITSSEKQRHGGTLIYAYVGPTNTGKTYRAIQRMLELKGGMIGLPLRLLAREVYEKLCAQVSIERVALITGEERIVPDRSTFFVCTVESMPMDIEVPIVVIDEVQLASHPVRGHIFTDRMLYARGVQETWLLGSDSMIPIIERLIPTAEIKLLKRRSRLLYKQPKPVQGLPKRSAIISFTIAQLYEIAESIRRSKGGVAVVMGAMSPQSRNAQVELFQSRKVDYLVATDAIGMGLNLDIKHVCFASLSKFDGRQQRFLSLSEIGQIAGRAGRDEKDGFFGLSRSCHQRFPLSETAIHSVEQQVFLPVRKVYYRNSDLNFESVEHFWRSLYKRPFAGCLMPMRDAMDERSMKYLTAEEDIQQLLVNPTRLAFLWEVCQIPDYRQDSDLAHFRLLKTIYKQLTQDEGVLLSNWVERQVDRLAQYDGDISRLLRQMAYTRTWGYIAHRSDWLVNPTKWRARIATIEQQLSELLHERLTQRFIDDENDVGIRSEPEDIYIEGDTLWCRQMTLGWLTSFSFRSNIPADVRFGSKFVRSIAHKWFQPVVQNLFKEMMKQSSWRITSSCAICWNDIVLAKCLKGRKIKEPKLQLLPMEMLNPRQKKQLELGLKGWLQHQIDQLYALFPSSSDGTQEIVYDVRQGLGSVERLSLSNKGRLSKGQRQKLSRQYVVVGHHFLYNAYVFKVRYQTIRFLLYTIWNGLCEIPERPNSEVAFQVRWPKGFGRKMGYYTYAGYVIRADSIDKIRWFLRKKVSSYPAAIPKDPMNWLGVGPTTWEKILGAMGYQIQQGKIVG